MTLPDEVIVEEILMRLPVKSVVRFRSVCKLWNSLLSEPSYIQSLLNFSMFGNSDEDCLILRIRNLFPDGYHSRLSMLSRSTLSEIHIDNVPYFVYSKDSIHIVGSINGLVCLGSFSFRDRSFMLWNPVTHLFKKIVAHERVSRMLGFSWDPVEKDFKIIGKPCYSSKAVVYSSKTDCWSDIVVPKFTSDITEDLSFFPSAIVKGVCYWTSVDSTSSKILKFEARNNRLTYLDIPCVRGSYSLVNLNDCLARVDYSWDGSGPMDVYTFHEETSLWSKIYTFNTEMINFENDITCFKSGGMIVAFDGKYNLYDSKSNEIKSFGSYNGTEGNALYGFSYTPTLVVLEGMKPLHLLGPKIPLTG